MQRYLFIALALLILLPTVSKAESSMYDRVCPRVVNRFQTDAKMWDRVNERIKQRFGFACVKGQASSSSLSWENGQAPMPSTFKSVSQCTPNAWKCFAAGTCENGMVENHCYLEDRDCLNSDAAKPPNKISCGASSSSSSASVCKGPEGYCELFVRMDKNIADWNKAREKLTAKMKEMANNTQSGCMATLSLIDGDWVSQYNNYIELYKKITFWNLDTVGNPIRQIEGRMAEITKRINDAPTFCY